MEPSEPCLLLLKAAQRIRSRIDARLALCKTGGRKVTYQYFLVLDHVAQHQGCSRVALVCATGIDNRRVSELVAALIKDGCITEEVEPFTRVKGRLECTTEGFYLLVDARDKRDAACEPIEDALGEQTLEEMGRLAEQIVLALPLTDRSTTTPNPKREGHRRG